MAGAAHKNLVARIRPRCHHDVRLRRLPAAAADTVVVYSALDREFSEPLLKATRNRAAARVLSKFDVESTKTVGLTNLIIAEAAPPALRPVLEQRDPEHAPAQGKGLARPVPAQPGGRHSRDVQGQGRHVVRLRRPARILIVNTKLVAEADRPKGIKRSCSTRSGRARSASPSRSSAPRQPTPPACSPPGATRRPRAYFHDLKANGVQVLSGNKQVATAVGSGQIAFGLTDTDDAMGEIEAGSPVAIVYPDREPDELGTLFIPNTLAIMKGSPHPKAAEALADHLLSPRDRIRARPRAERPDPAAQEHRRRGASRDAQDRPRDGSRLRRRGEDSGTRSPHFWPPNSRVK